MNELWVLSFLYVYSDHSILECYNLFSGVELSMRSFFVICLILVSVEINLKLLLDFLALLKTSNWYFEMSDCSLTLKKKSYSTMGKVLINICFKVNKLKLWLKLFGFLKTINHFLKQGIPPCF